jgi:hypothetical protein
MLKNDFDFMNRLRQTGRTTRMMQHAATLTKAGARVFILVHEGELRHMKQTYGHMNAEIIADSHNVDYNTMVWSKCPDKTATVLFDHAVIECRLVRAIETMMAYAQNIRLQSPDGMK